MRAGVWSRHAKTFQRPSYSVYILDERGAACGPRGNGVHNKMSGQVHSQRGSRTAYTFSQTRISVLTSNTFSIVLGLALLYKETRWRTLKRNTVSREKLLQTSPMPTFQSHLTVLASSAAKHSTSVAFRIPIFDTASDDVKEWGSITYRRFKGDVEFVSRYWTREFKSNGIPRGSVVGLW